MNDIMKQEKQMKEKSQRERDELAAERFTRENDLKVRMSGKRIYIQPAIQTTCVYRPPAYNGHICR